MSFVDTSLVVLNNYVQSFLVFYKEIPNYYGAYCVGTDGSVWSKWVRIGQKWIIGTDKDWRSLRLSVYDQGYPVVNLCRDKKPKKFRVHKLVAEAFIGPCPVGMEVCHEDGDYGNSHLCNLRYDTRKNNEADKIKHCTNGCGERNSNAFLTWEIVGKIRAEYAAGGVTLKVLASRHNIVFQSVSRIIRNEAWVRL